MASVGLVFLGFIIGALVVLAVEGLSFYLFIFWIRRKAEAPQNPPRVPSDLDSEQWLTSACKKQGIVWFLEHENIPKVSLDEPQTGAPKELRMKKVIVQVHPMKKYAKIKDRLLILIGSDGSETTIKLLDYTILAVSSSSLPSKKWAKKYPIILESKVSSVCNGSKTSYLYFDTSWEKESWCKALRLASSRDKKLLNWYNQISQEFNSYLASLNTEFPSFLKPSAIPGEVVEKTIRVDGSSSYSKARIFLKKIAKKASKSGVESRENTVSSTRDVRRTPEKLVAHNDIRTPDGSVKSSLEEKCSSSSFPDLVQLGNKGLHPTMPDIVCDDKLLGDEGTLCLNLLLSRLFFDAKRSAEMKNLVKMRIQKALSNLRTPIYVRGLACANLDLGNLPPYIHKIRVLPMDLTEVWAVEVDIEYLGGLLLDIETRIEVREPELQDEIINASSEPSYNGEASSLLEGIEHYSKQLNFSASLGDQSEKRDEEGNVDTLRQSKISSQFPVSKSKWKTILHSIAEQVSQAAVRDNLVLPNCECLSIPWMLAEKDDWVPQKAAPFVRINQESIDISLPAVDSTSTPGDHKPNVGISGGAKPGSGWVPEVNSEEVKDIVCVQLTPDDPDLFSVPSQVSQTQSDAFQSTSSSSTIRGDLSSAGSSQGFHASTSGQLLVPLLSADGNQPSSSQSRVDFSRTSTLEEQPSAFSEEDKAKRMGRRARMMDLGKKVGEKLEEKRRHIEEKSRHIVEKMRENSRS